MLKSTNTGKIKDISGQKFGRLTAIRRAGANISGQAMWECLCECGKTHVTCGATLRNGTVVSCGCYNREASGKRAFVHGRSAHPLYEPWKSMHERCRERNKEHRERYADRNIAVCPEWSDVNTFIRDMEPTWVPNQRLTLERKDNNLGYSPDNCRWADMTEQNNNKENNHPVTYLGRTQNISQWGRELNLSGDVISGRLRIGWTVEKAMTEPVRPCVRRSAPRS